MIFFPPFTFSLPSLYPLSNCLTSLCAYYTPFLFPSLPFSHLLLSLPTTIHASSLFLFLFSIVLLPFSFLLQFLSSFLLLTPYSRPPSLSFLFLGQYLAS